MEETRRIVLLGKTGAGKSSLANTILGEDVFTVGHTFNSETKECRAETRSVNGRSITLIDTPGFFDTHMSEEELKSKIVRCVTECAPGARVFLIVLKVEKFTKQEKDVIQKICEYFSEEPFKYAAVVFNRGDQLEEEMEIEDFVEENEELSDLVKKCGGRCHVVDNRYWKNNRPDEYRSNQIQVAELLNTIDKMLENKGYYFPAVPACSESHQQRRIEDRMNDRLRREKLHKLPQKSGVFAAISQRRAEGSAQPSKNYSASLQTDVTETRRIVLLGKTGSGKSSLANTIFGEEVFTVGHSYLSETKECQAETRSVNGRSITLIDTPSLFDRDRPEEEMRTEIVRCITECAPGPHAFLIVLKVERITEQEKDVIRKICEYFSEDAFKYAAVVFTHGDQLPEGMKIEEIVKHNKCLCDLMKKCGGRCHVVDNKYWQNNRPDEYRSNQFQVAELLNTIDKIVMENNGGYYDYEANMRQEDGAQRLCIIL